MRIANCYCQKTENGHIETISLGDDDLEGNEQWEGTKNF